MSTKIYEAYRVPAKHLNAFLTSTGDQMFSRVVERADMLMENMKLDAIYKSLVGSYKDEKWAKKYFNDGKPSRYVKLEVVLREARKAAENLERDIVLDIECGWSIRIRKNFAYLIPYGERVYFKGIEFPDYSLDYAYWNNSDQPAKISDQKWRSRGKLWDEILKESPVLIHTVIDLLHDFVNVKCRLEKEMRLGFWAESKT